MIKNLLERVRSQKGFTLLELLVVIAIIAILAAVIIVNLNSARVSANDARVQSAVAGISQALTLYSAQNNPTGWTQQTTLVSQTAQPFESTAAYTRLNAAGSLPEAPEHPVADQSYQYKGDVINGEFKFIVWGNLYAGANNGKCFVATSGLTRVAESEECATFSGIDLSNI